MKITCPKCNSPIGLHYSEYPVKTFASVHGLNCFLCGYWMHLTPAPFKSERLEMAGRKS